MNEDIHQVVSRNIVSMEIIIQGKREIRERTIVGRTLERCLCKAFQCEFRQADMGVVLNVGPIIKRERALQGVGVEEEDKDSQKREFQGMNDRFEWDDGRSC